MNRDNLPHYLTALFTLALSVLAYFAWTESKRTTAALNEQVLAIRAEQRPFLWFQDAEQPTFHGQPTVGQILWNVQYTNTGKGVAYNAVVTRYIKIGDERYQPSYRQPVQLEGVVVPPGKVNFFTFVSRPGISQEYANSLMSVDRAFGVLMEFQYTDATGKERYSDTACLERLATGALLFRDPAQCPR